MERNAVLKSDLALAKVNDAALCRKTKPKNNWTICEELYSLSESTDAYDTVLCLG